MNEKKIYTLLSIVKNNGDIKRLTRLGLNFANIAELTKDAIKNNFLIYKDGVVQLTEFGNDKIINLEAKFKQINKDLWIEPENESKIPVLEKNFIFLPNQNELHF